MKCLETLHVFIFAYTTGFISGILWVKRQKYCWHNYFVYQISPLNIYAIAFGLAKRVQLCRIIWSIVQVIFFVRENYFFPVYVLFGVLSQHNIPVFTSMSVEFEWIFFLSFLVSGLNDKIGKPIKHTRVSCTSGSSVILL